MSYRAFDLTDGQDIDRSYADMEDQVIALAMVMSLSTERYNAHVIGVIHVETNCFTCFVHDGILYARV